MKEKFLVRDETTGESKILFTVWWHNKSDNYLNFNIRQILGDNAHEANAYARTLANSGDCDMVTESNSKTGRTVKFL